MHSWTLIERDVQKTFLVNVHHSSTISTLNLSTYRPLCLLFSLVILFASYQDTLSLYVVTNLRLPPTASMPRVIRKEDAPLVVY